MEINILLFGSLIDAADGRAELQLENVQDTDAVKHMLLKRYPKLKDYTFRIALNQQILEGNHVLNNNDVVAFLPPFAGG